MANYYEVGDSPIISGEFTDTSSGALTDPADVFGEFTDPSGNITLYDYGTDVELVRDGVGQYHFVVAIDEAGVWNYRMYSTGSGATASYGHFFASSPAAPSSGIRIAYPIP